ncbi:MAG: glycosyltransferase family 2 protein [Opitutales bacterium]|jgi:glycosyltransferase involved in cell wall biosynthesis
MKISVLTPSFNSEAFIERAIQSVLAQDSDQWEHIVVDGGSTDGTLAILKKYPRLKWISEPDRGQSDAMNKAFRLSSGDLIGYLNSDDYYEPRVFQHVLDCFANSGADLVAGTLSTHLVAANTTTLSIPPTRLDEILDPKQYGFPYNPASYFYRRAVQESIGPFPLEEHYAMDYWFLLRAYQSFKIHRTDRLLGHNYVSPNCKSARLLESQSALFLVLYDFLTKTPGLDAPKYLQLFVSHLLRDAINTRNERDHYQKKFWFFANSRPWRLVRKLLRRPQPRPEIR